MTSIRINLSSLFSEQHLETYSIGSVATSISIPLEKITSVLENAILQQGIDMLNHGTTTDSAVSQSIEETILLVQATINHYSNLTKIATTTVTSDPVFAQAAEGSFAMKTSEMAFYYGNTISLGGNLALAIIFGILLILQIAFGGLYKQRYFLILWTIGLMLEILGYSGRVWLHYNIYSLNAYLLQSICIALGPSALIAGLYYIFSQMVHVYGEHQSILKPTVYLLAFLLFDSISGALLGAGSGIAANSTKYFETGVNIMTAGMSLQIATILFLQALWYYFIWNIYHAYKRDGDSAFTPKFVQIRGKGVFNQCKFIIGVSITMVLLFVRSIYRLIEIIEGANSKFVYDEIYFVILESLMVVLACAIMTICHPGFMFGRAVNVDAKRKLGLLAIIFFLIEKFKQSRNSVNKEEEEEEDDDEEEEGPEFEVKEKSLI